jgi:hypothetical protein
MLPQRRIPGYELRSRNRIKSRSRQRRHVQRLANMADIVRPRCVLVEERTAAGEIQQSSASQQCQSTPRGHSARNESSQSHRATLYLTTVDALKRKMVSKKYPPNLANP